MITRYSCRELYDIAKFQASTGEKTESKSVEGVQGEREGLEYIGARFNLERWEDRDELIQETGYSLEYLKREFEERTDFERPHNPGRAFELSPEKEKLFYSTNNVGMFTYTYSERMFRHLGKIIDLLKKDPSTRQAYLSIWDRDKDQEVAGKDMVPCSLGFHFLIRNNKLTMVYFLRSLDAERFPQDIYLSTRLIDFVAEKLGIEPRRVIFLISSLHVFF